MSVYTIYAPRTGVVLRSGNCPEAMVDLQVRDASKEAVARLQANDLKHTIEIVDGAARLKDIVR